jgi:hypothetical protein
MVLCYAHASGRKQNDYPGHIIMQTLWRLSLVSNQRGNLAQLLLASVVRFANLSNIHSTLLNIYLLIGTG